MHSAPNADRAGRVRLLSLTLAITATYAAVELIAWAAFEPLTGAAYGSPLPETDVAPPSPDVKRAREQAGLGMRDPAMSLHPYFGYVYTPPEPDAEPGRIAISPDGFLDHEPPVRKRDDRRLLVGILGGSVAGQLGTWHSEGLREALLESAGLGTREVEFVRLGMPGYHQPQQLHQLTYLLAQGGELDVLLNVDGFNEVAVPGALNAPRGTHPLFPMNWSMVALDVPDLALRREIGAIEFLSHERRRKADELVDSWRSYSPLARLLWRLNDRELAQQLAQRKASLRQFDAEEIPYFVRGPERHHDLAEDLIPFCVDVWKRSSLQMQALCLANDIRYLHVLQPNQYDPGSKPLSAEEQQTAYDAESPYRGVVEQGYPLLRAAGAELSAAGIQFLDLSRLFEGHAETYYVDNCCHFNAPANELLSEAIAAALAHT